MKRFLDELSREQRWIFWTLAALVLFLIVTSIFPDIGLRKTSRSLEVGKTIDVAITLVTSDVFDLACASNDEMAGAKCLYDANGSARPALADGDAPGRSERVLAPYMTTDDVLFLIPGMFAQPAVAKRHAEEPPTVGREALRRFTAACQLTLQGQIKDVAVRWSRQAAFGPRPGGAWVGRVSSCKIETP